CTLMHSNSAPRQDLQHTAAATGRYEFIREDLLQEAPTVRHISRATPPASMQTACLDVLQRFLDEQNLYAIPVIDDLQIPRLLVDRNTFVEFFTKPFTREIFGRQPICALLTSPNYINTDPIVTEDASKIEKDAQIIISTSTHNMLTVFIF